VQPHCSESPDPVPEWIDRRRSACIGGFDFSGGLPCMRKLLVCQHVAFEILGTLNPLLKDAGFRIRYVNFGRHPAARPHLDGYHGLVILGGPMGVQQVHEHPHLPTEVALVRDAIDRNIPVLGICLGAQLIAQALGARVGPNREKEIGWYDVELAPAGKEDPLLRHFRPRERIFQWHSDTFTLPRGAVHLAASAACGNQAFRYRNNVYALQFHLEVDEALIERWLRVPIHREELRHLHGKIAPEDIRRETPQRIERTKQLSRQVFGAFIDLFGIGPKRRMLRSR
jgi:GMP synthase (glutamine-hydrolysing)